MSPAAAIAWYATPVTPDAAYAAGRLDAALVELESALDSLRAASRRDAAPEIAGPVGRWRAEITRVMAEIETTVKQLEASHVA